MSEESRYYEDEKSRHLNDVEIHLIAQMLRTNPEYGHFVEHLPQFEVQSMKDGGMGSLYFRHPSKEPRFRRLGRRIAELQFRDEDGIDVIVSLNVDQDGDIYEMDVWKTDFSALIRLPDSTP